MVEYPPDEVSGKTIRWNIMCWLYTNRVLVASHRPCLRFGVVRAHRRHWCEMGHQMSRGLLGWTPCSRAGRRK